MSLNKYGKAEEELSFSDGLIRFSPSEYLEDTISTEYRTGIAGLKDLLCENIEEEDKLIVSFFDLLPQIKIQHLNNIGLNIRNLQTDTRMECFLFSCEPTEDPDGMFVPIVMRLAISSSMARLIDYEDGNYLLEIISASQEQHIAQAVEQISCNLPNWIDFYEGKTDWIPPFFRGFSAGSTQIIEDYDQALIELQNLLSD